MNQFNFNNRMPNHPNTFFNNYDTLICRICLSSKPKSENVPVSLIVQPFRDITNQELKFDPELPDTLCTNCCMEINNFWSYRKMIIEKQNQLLINLNNKRKMTIGPHRVFHPLYTVSVQNQTPNTFHQSSPPPLSRSQPMNFPNPHPLRPPPPNHAQNPRPLQPGQFPRNPNMSPQPQQTHPGFIRLSGPRIKRTYMKKKQPESSPPFPTPGRSTNAQSQPYMNGSSGNSDQMKTFVTTNNNSAIETFEIIELPDERNQDDINSLPEYIPLEPESILSDSISTTPRISQVNSIRNLENFLETDIRTEDLMMDLFRASPSPPLFTSTLEETEMKMKPPKPKKPKAKRRKVHTPKEGFREKCVVCGFCTPDRNYYPLPADTDRRLKWLELINIADIRIPENSVICEDHFIETNFQYYPDMKRNLKKKAIPTVTDNEKEISRMRHLALNAGIIKDCSVVLMVQQIKTE